MGKVQFCLHIVARFSCTFEICLIVSSVKGKNNPIVYRAGGRGQACLAHTIRLLAATLKPLDYPHFLTDFFLLKMAEICRRGVYFWYFLFTINN